MLFVSSVRLLRSSSPKHRSRGSRVRSVLKTFESPSEQRREFGVGPRWTFRKDDDRRKIIGSVATFATRSHSQARYMDPRRVGEPQSETAVAHHHWRGGFVTHESASSVSPRARSTWRNSSSSCGFAETSTRGVPTLRPSPTHTKCSASKANAPKSAATSRPISCWNGDGRNPGRGTLSSPTAISR